MNLINKFIYLFVLVKETWKTQKNGSEFSRSAKRVGGDGVKSRISKVQLIST